MKEAVNIGVVFFFSAQSCYLLLFNASFSNEFFLLLYVNFVFASPLTPQDAQKKLSCCSTPIVQNSNHQSF